MKRHEIRSDEMMRGNDKEISPKKCPEQEIVSAPHSGLLDILWARSVFLPAYRLYMFITFAPACRVLLLACMFVLERGFP